jgi:hypothetical protein
MCDQLPRNQKHYMLNMQVIVPTANIHSGLAPASQLPQARTSRGNPSVTSPTFAAQALTRWRDPVPARRVPQR